MIVLCTICTDLINQTDNIYVTLCGHMFHYDCLRTWIERSKSCPQCRDRVTTSCMFRVYPNTSDATTSKSEDAADLMVKLDNTLLKVHQQSLELKMFAEKINETAKTLAATEKTVKYLEKEMIFKDALLMTYKEQMQYLKTENKELDKLKEELELQNNYLQTFHGLQKVFDSTVEDVENMLKSYTDVRTVATFACALKKALYEIESKKTELRNSLLSTRQDLTEEKKKNEEWQTKYIQLQEKFTTIMNQYEILKNKGIEVNVTAVSCLDDSWSLATKWKELSPKENEENANTTSPKRRRMDNTDSPYLTLKRGNFLWPSQQRPTTSKGEDTKKSPKKYTVNNKPETVTTMDQDVSIFHEKEQASVETASAQKKTELNINYDGLGGHSSRSSEICPIPSVEPVRSKITSKLFAKRKLTPSNPAGTKSMKAFLKPRQE